MEFPKLLIPHNLLVCFCDHLFCFHSSYEKVCTSIQSFLLSPLFTFLAYLSIYLLEFPFQDSNLPWCLHTHWPLFFSLTCGFCLICQPLNVGMSQPPGHGPFSLFYLYVVPWWFFLVSLRQGIENFQIDASRMSHSSDSRLLCELINWYLPLDL